MHDPPPTLREGLGPGRAERLCHEVAAKEAPQRAVVRRVDVVLVEIDDACKGRGKRPSCQGCAHLNQGLMGQVTTSNENHCLFAKIEAEDRPITSSNSTEGGHDMGKVEAQLVDVTDDGQRRWARREATSSFALAVALRRREAEEEDG
uniref:Uncharacterized protein n=1 Tax=Nymphaea colorata TaxID=210225 RepID=A0A5K1GVI2_9MAGN